MTDDDKASANPVRIDIWLWAARFFKTRSLAKQAIDGGKIEINQASCKVSRPVRPGDIVQVSRGTERMSVEVLDVSTQRGPAPVAQALYRESAESQAAREAMREQRRLTGAGLDHPQGRPSKQDRRLIQRFKQVAHEDLDQGRE